MTFQKHETKTINGMGVVEEEVSELLAATKNWHA